MLNALNRIELKLITFVDGRNSVLEIDQSGQVVDAVLIRLGGIGDAHEEDVALIAFVVDFLQFLQHHLAGLHSFLVC